MVLSTLDRASGYKVEEITLYPYDSDIRKKVGGIEISNLVSKFSLTESMAFLGVSLSMTIIDGVNLIERFNLSGNEKINLVISKYDVETQTENKIDLIFIIANYPLFGKSKNKRYQAFNIECIPEHCFLDNIISVSQHFGGSPSEIVKNILTNYLEYPEERILLTDNVNTLYDYVVPNITPLQAIRNILKTSCDMNLAPIVAWETLKGFNLYGYSEIIERKPYKKRIYKVNNFSDGSGNNDDQKIIKELTTVLDFSSNLKMSKFEQATNGAFASLTKQYDYLNKTYNEIIFDYTKSKDDIKYLSPYTSFSDKFLINNNDLSKYPESKEIFFMTNDKLNTNFVLNGQSHIHDKIKQSYLAQSEHMTHTLVLNGDLDLSSGEIISLLVPPGIFDEKVNDEYFTGNYLIMSITHNFDSAYTMEVKIQKDGLETELS